MPEHAWDVIVIGVGAMGSAACWALARRGVRVLGLERFRIGHDLGSSGGETRMIRKAYFEHPDYVPLLGRAYQLWDELDAATGEPVLRRTGALYVGAEDGELVSGSLASARRHHLPHEHLGNEELRRRYPMFRVPESHAAVFEPDGGYLLSERAIVAMASEARRHGAEIREEEAVRNWTARAGDVSVRTERGTYAAAAVVLTAGAWTAALAHDFAVPLRVTRQIIGWVRPADAEPFREARFPCWAIDEGGGLFYGFPIRAGDVFLKAGNHRAGEGADPDRLDRRISEADREDFLVPLRRFLPSAVGPVARAHACLYTWSPDGHFVIDRHPLHQRAFVACGFSGHGFKFAPVVGEALADLSTAGRTNLPTEFLAASRFAAR